MSNQPFDPAVNPLSQVSGWRQQVRDAQRLTALENLLSPEGTPIPGTSGAQTITMDSGVKNLTPTGAITLNATGGTPGQLLTLIVTTSGTSSHVITFGSNFKAVGTLATGTVTAKVFTITFRCKDGTLWVETGRTAAM